MTTSAMTTTKSVIVAGIGPVELTIEERGEGQPFLLLHGGAGPQSVAAFAQLHNCSPRRTTTACSPPSTPALAAHRGRRD
jgi:hypothetical protein